MHLKFITKQILLILFTIFISGIKTRAQSPTGTGGVLLTPNAYFQSDGLIQIGGNHLPYALLPPNWTGDSYNYYVNLTFLPFLELTYLQTFINSLHDGKGGYKQFSGQDRAISARIALFKEKKYRPAIAIGGYDLISHIDEEVESNQYFSSLFVTTSKTIHIKKQNLCLNLGYGFKEIRHTNITGLFGSLVYQPLGDKRLEALLEYDTKRINYGVRTLWFKHLSTYICLYDCKHLSGGLSYSIQLP